MATMNGGRYFSWKPSSYHRQSCHELPFLKRPHFQASSNNVLFRAIWTQQADGCHCLMKAPSQSINTTPTMYIKDVDACISFFHHTTLSLLRPSKHKCTYVPHSLQPSRLGLISVGYKWYLIVILLPLFSWLSL